MFERTESTALVARDKSGQPLGHAGVVTDDAVCLIWFAVASSHDARWALHDYLVRTLIARRVRYLLCEGGGLFGALGYVAGTQHYQQLLGYELRHMIPIREPQPNTRRRRLLASLVATAITVGTLFVHSAAASVLGAAS
jgi:hypothetical protein